MSKVRYVGRESYFKGKTLFEIAANLKTCKGRVVYRNKYLRYPEKTYCILEDVVPDLSNQNFKAGTASGIKVFRGARSDNVSPINTGMKQDWFLVPKEEQEEFCEIDKVHHPCSKCPPTIQLPPLMAVVLKTLPSEVAQKTELHVKSRLLPTDFSEPEVPVST